MIRAGDYVLPVPLDDHDGERRGGRSAGELLVWIGERADDRSSATTAPVYHDALRALHRRRAEGFEG